MLMNDEVSEAPATGSTGYVRNSRGQFVAGGAGGPGRMPRQALRKYVEAVKPLVPTRAQMTTGLAV